MLMLPSPNLPKTCQKIEAFIKKKVQDANAEGVVVGLSGGVDSSTTAFLCVRALGADAVFGLIMPDEKVTPKDDVEDAKLVAEKLGIKYEVIEISRICESITSLYLPSKKDPVAEGNVKARVRMTLLYYAANKLKRLVVGSGDRSEILIGYFTKYGDGGVDLLPLGGLYKTQVRELAKFIGVPSHIVAKPSSPRLWVGHTAEDELGLSYGSLDLILHGLIDLKMDREKVAMEVGAQLETVERVERMVEATQHKRSMPPIAEVWVP